MSTFAVGDAVKIRTLKKVGLIIEVLGTDRYKVAVGSLTITCTSVQLEKSQKKSLSQEVSTGRTNQPAVVTAKRNTPAHTLDLHGKRVTEAVSALEKWLDTAILAGLDRVTVIHGHGTGRVQSAVHSYLSTISAVSSFQVNPFNSGETIIYL